MAIDAPAPLSIQSTLWKRRLSLLALDGVSLIALAQLIVGIGLLALSLSGIGTLISSSIYNNANGLEQAIKTTRQSFGDAVTEAVASAWPLIFVAMVNLFICRSLYFDKVRFVILLFPIAVFGISGLKYPNPPNYTQGFIEFDPAYYTVAFILLFNASLMLFANFNFYRQIMPDSTNILLKTNNSPERYKKSKRHTIPHILRFTFQTAFAVITFSALKTLSSMILLNTSITKWTNILTPNIDGILNYFQVDIFIVEFLFLASIILLNKIDQKTRPEQTPLLNLVMWILLLLFVFSSLFKFYISADMDRLIALGVESWPAQIIHRSPDTLSGLCSMTVFLSFFSRRLKRTMIKIRRSLQLEADRASEDSTFILTLRSFHADEHHIRATRSITYSGFGAPMRQHSLIQTLVDEAYRFYPTIGAENPHTSDHYIGISPQKLTDENWKEYISEKLITSKFNILIAGRTDNLKWEIDNIVTNGQAQKTIIVFPPGDVDHVSHSDYKTLTPFNLSNPPGNTRVCFWMDKINNFVCLTTPMKDTFAYRECLRFALHQRLGNDLVQEATSKD